jgi:C1A family cysteine protease
MAPVKDQLYCGSCYSFAATSVVEYQTRKNGEPLTLSQQNILDCDTNSYGCDGGWPATALGYVRDEGIAEDSVYIYEAAKNECRKEMFPPVYRVQNICEVDVENDEEKLKKLVATVGPVAAVIQATNALYNYGDGVLYDPTCDSNAFDHAVVKESDHFPLLFIIFDTLTDNCRIWNKSKAWRLLDHQKFMGRKLGTSRLRTHCEKQK